MPVLHVQNIVTNVMLPQVVSASPPSNGIVTHYGVTYDGQTMGCTGQTYASTNATIIAVSPVDEGSWPCGTSLRVCGPAGCIVGIRQDSCPGCGHDHLDLSEAGIDQVCGDQAGVCEVTIEKVSWQAEVHSITAAWVDY